MYLKLINKILLTKTSRPNHKIKIKDPKNTTNRIEQQTVTKLPEPPKEDLNTSGIKRKGKNDRSHRKQYPGHDGTGNDVYLYDTENNVNKNHRSTRQTNRTFHCVVLRKQTQKDLTQN